jgi:hypothetical protein
MIALPDNSDEGIEDLTEISFVPNWPGGALEPMPLPPPTHHREGYV